MVCRWCRSWEARPLPPFCDCPRRATPVPRGKLFRSHLHPRPPPCLPSRGRRPLGLSGPTPCRTGGFRRVFLVSIKLPDCGHAESLPRELEAFLDPLVQRARCPPAPSARRIAGGSVLAFGLLALDDRLDAVRLPCAAAPRAR